MKCEFKSYNKMIRIKDSTIVVIAFLLACTSCKLEVINFSQLDQSLFDSSLLDIPYSIANFGFSPFGKTMISNLKDSPFGNECILNSSAGVTKQFENSFILIPRGQCPFVTKAVNAQELGVAMVIIMDNIEHKRSVIMKDNGYGYKVNIPSIFIDYQYSQKLLNLMNRTESMNSKVMLKISFENHKTEKVAVNLYMQSMNPIAYKFILDFQPYYEKIKDHITLNIIYEFIRCKSCNAEDCFYNGSYCSVSYAHGKSATGKDVMNQQLRETVMFSKYPSKWWDYMKCIQSECVSISEVEQCSNEKCISKKLKMKPEDFKREVEQSFNIDGDNQYMKQQSEVLSMSGVETFPAVTINSVKIKGSLKPEFVFDDICNTLISPPSACSSYIQINKTSTINKTYWTTVILVILLGAALFVALFVIFRRRMRSKMTVDMQGRVDDMVSKYIEFYSERNNRQ